MPASCENPACRVPLVVGNRSHDNPKHCAECGDLVYAFRPDREQPGDWYLVSDGAPPEEGDVVSGGQCEICALNEFRVIKVARSAWEAWCVGQVADGSKIAGCYSKHPIRMKMRCETILPWSETAAV